MINSRWDSALPKNNVMALWKKLGEPEIHWFYGGHVSILINSKKVLKKILRHFRRTLK